MTPLNRMVRRPVCDANSEMATRTDTVPASVRFAEEESVPTSGYQWRAANDLVPYPALAELPSSCGEPTVPDAALQRVSVSAARVEHTEERAPSVTPVPPARTPSDRVSVTPATSMRASSRRTIAPVAQASASAPATHPPATASTRQILVIAALSVIAAFAIGASLGDGSLARLVEQARAAISPPAPAPARLPLSRPAVVPVPRVAPPRAKAPSPAAAPEIAHVPVVRLDELPVAEQTPEPASSEPEAVAPRVHARRTRATHR